jgi:hypothetical protein
MGRSRQRDHDVMSRKKLKRGVGGSSDRFIRLPHYMIKCHAYRTMHASAKALFTEVWLRHNGVNNGEISFSCREAAELLGWSYKTAARMFAILIERGFLVVVRESKFDRKKIARIWRITSEPYHGEPPTKEFMRWRPDVIVAREPKSFPSVTGDTHSVTGVHYPEESDPTVS